MFCVKKSLFSIIVLLLIVFFGCDNHSEQAEVAKDSKELEQESEANEYEDTWGYSDKGKDPSEITEEAPLEVEGGLVHDVGIICDGQKLIYALNLKNTSNEAWKLQDISADCSCTNIDGIPGGIMLEPGKIWKLGIRIDGGRINPGNFEKHLTLEPLNYKPVVITIKGILERFYQTTPASRKLSFDTKGRPDEQWQSTLEFEGIGKAKDILEVELIPSKKTYLNVQLKKIAEGKWSVEVTPAKTLPYCKNFIEYIELKTLEPEGFPNVRLLVQGKVGIDLEWRSHFIKLKEEDFVDGIAERCFQLGVDMNDTFTPGGQRLLRIAEGVDWKKLFSTLEIKAPEGVETKMEQGRMGVRLDVKIKKDVFNAQKMITIESGCNGNWEGKPIKIAFSNK